MTVPLVTDPARTFTAEDYWGTAARVNGRFLGSTFPRVDGGGVGRRRPAIDFLARQAPPCSGAAVAGQRWWKSGVRFSTKAAMPSF